jgi:hypothetical protein
MQPHNIRQKLCQGDTIQPHTTIVGRVVTQRDESLLVSGSLNNGRYDALLPVEKSQIFVGKV